MIRNITVVATTLDLAKRLIKALESRGVAASYYPVRDSTFIAHSYMVTIPFAESEQEYVHDHALSIADAIAEARGQEANP